MSPLNSSNVDSQGIKFELNISNKTSKIISHGTISGENITIKRGVIDTNGVIYKTTAIDPTSLSDVSTIKNISFPQHKISEIPFGPSMGKFIEFIQFRDVKILNCAYSQNGNRTYVYHDNTAQYNGRTYQTTDPLCITGNNTGNDSIIITSSGLTNQTLTFDLIIGDLNLYTSNLASTFLLNVPHDSTSSNNNITVHIKFYGNIVITSKHWVFFNETESNKYLLVFDVHESPVTFDLTSNSRQVFGKSITGMIASGCTVTQATLDGQNVTSRINEVLQLQGSLHAGNGKHLQMTITK